MTKRRRVVTLRDVALKAGVSIRTVSNVVNNYPHVREETRSRVEAAVEELGYRINPIARNLRIGSTKTLGLLLPQLSQPYYAELGDLMLSSARERGYTLIVEAVRHSDPVEMKSVIGELQLMTDGLLLSPPHLGPDDHWMKAIDVPVVVLSERQFDSGVDHVTMDSYAGARLATDHLVAIGRRKIAVLGVPKDEERLATSRLRFDGHLASLAAANLPRDERLYRYIETWTAEEGFKAMTEILRANLHVDSVFAFNDPIAIGALHAIDQARLRVPKDIAVVGFDDVALARYLKPPLTTIAPGMDEVVNKALDRLLARIEGTYSGPPDELRTKCEIRVRASTVETE